MSPARRATKRTSRSGKSTGGDLLIRGGWVVAVDVAGSESRLDVRIADGRIAAMAPRLSQRGVERVIDARDMIVMPGLVQAHIHVCQTLFRGQADDMDLLTWLRERIWPLEGALEADDLRAGARLGFAELLLGGTTAILDMGTVRHSDVLFEEALRMGLRYTGGKTIMDHGQGYPVGLRETTEHALAESARLCERWHGRANGRLRYAFSPRFVLSCTEAAMRGVVAEARRRGTVLHTHAAESSEEVALVRERTGMGNVEYLHSLGFSGRDVVLAHGIWLSSEERRLLRETGTHIAHCPSANLKLASGIARVAELLGEGIHVALGADGAACNNLLDGFGEMRLAARLHKVHSGPEAVAAGTALRLATRGGAEALGLNDTGSLAVGQRADLVLLDVHRPHLWPHLGSLASRVVYAARASDVHTVVVDGRVIVDAGRLTTGKVATIVRDAQAAAERVAARVG
ncbi:MAG: 5'-deoxyadenosine deaminase [Deltaproteobacteria bacterium]|nr:5'-deoxyadenosine deaminase [Deltaproteobacteria bacterium]